MAEKSIEKFFCNRCKGQTRHFVRSEYETIYDDEHGYTSLTARHCIIECCGCGNIAFVKKTHFSEDLGRFKDPATGQEYYEALWDEEIYPPVTYRSPPPWFDDLPDDTLREISGEIYKSLQSGSHYLATFGSRTLIDRLIVLTVGDQGSFPKGLQTLQDRGMLSLQERDILDPVVEAGNAAAHRGWAPNKEQLTVILDTVEGLIHRLLVLPALTEELKEAVPSRGGHAPAKPGNSPVTVQDKINAAPKAVRATYDTLLAMLMGLGSDVSMRPKKHYIAFRRNRNFASVQVYNQKRIVRVYLNLDPDTVDLDASMMRDVRQIGHYGTGDLEVTLKNKKDLAKIEALIKDSYASS